MPEPPYAAGPQAADAGATSMIDVSDGLLADLGHIATASEVAIDVRTDLLDVPQRLVDVGTALGADPRHWVLTGGEDHALAATFPQPAAVPQGWRTIGTVTRGWAVTVDGEPYDGGPRLAALAVKTRGGVVGQNRARADRHRAAYDHPDAVALIDEVQQEYVVRYGGGTNARSTRRSSRRRTGSVPGRLPSTTSRWRAAAGGCAATDVELKRMYVTPAVRGRGLARAVLAELERTARRRRPPPARAGDRDRAAGGGRAVHVGRATRRCRASASTRTNAESVHLGKYLEDECPSTP